MNRRAFERHLRAHGCLLHRHGARHDVWLNPRNLRQTSVPRHPTVKRGVVRAACRALEVPPPAGF